MEFDGWSEVGAAGETGKAGTRPMYSIGIAVAQSGRWLCVRHGDNKNIVISHLGIFLLAVANPHGALGGGGVTLGCGLRPLQNRGGVVLRLRSLSSIPVAGPRPATSASSQEPRQE